LTNIKAVTASLKGVQERLTELHALRTQYAIDYAKALGDGTDITKLHKQHEIQIQIQETNKEIEETLAWKAQIKQEKASLVEPYKLEAHVGHVVEIAEYGDTNGDIVPVLECKDCDIELEVA